MIAAMLALGGCAELGLVHDGTSVSMGRPSGGYLIGGQRLPDHGEGFTTRDTWRQRGNRYGTDELVDLLTGVGRRIAARGKGPRLVVADLSGRRGGEARRWHRSHQTGRDVDLVYFVRDADGKPVEAEAMRRFDPDGKARDDSGLTVDVPRMWELVRDLVTAREATVQWVFMYEPIAQKLLAHAATTGEPDAVIARARLALKQPGDSAPHDDHMHVRVYCSEADRRFGCVDIGPRELWASRAAERAGEAGFATVVATLVGDAFETDAAAIAAPSDAAPPASSAAAAPAALAAPAAVSTFGRLLRQPTARMFRR